MVRTVFLVVLLYLWSPLRGGPATDITCPYMSSCVLPCLFNPGPEVVIHWLCLPEETKPVHTYYHEQDQLGHQNPQYKGRTALFKEQISKGNASLMLSRIKVTDSGKYKCYTSTIRGNHEDFINMTVQAPVSDMDLQQEGDELKCRSEGIYPRPEVSWNTSTEDNTRVYQTESGLYNIISSVTLSEHTEQEYTCNVSTHYSWRSATYRMRDPITVSDSKTTITCVDKETSIKSLVWTFNQTQTILNKTGSELFNESWRPFVDHETPSGSLVLKSLTSDQQGLYSCLLKTDTNIYMTNTMVHVNEAITSGLSIGILVGIIVVAIVVVALVVLVVVLCQRHKKNSQKTTSKRKANGTSEEVHLQCKAHSEPA